MREFYLSLVTLHVAAGATSLLSLLPPLLARKGGRLHRRAGWVFVAAMAATAASGFVIAALWIAAPLAVKPPSRPLAADELAARVDMMRGFALFLAYLGVLIFNALWHGLRALVVRRGQAVHGALADRAVATFVLGSGLALGLAGLVRGDPLMIGFGALGTRGGWLDLRYLGRPQSERTAWLSRHIDSMLGAVIAALTAFSVFNADRLFADAIPAGWRFLPWVLPTLIGVPATAVLRARHLRGRR